MQCQRHEASATATTGCHVKIDHSEGARSFDWVVGMPIVIAYSAYIYRAFAGKVVITQEGY